MLVCRKGRPDGDPLDGVSGSTWFRERLTVDRKDGNGVPDKDYAEVGEAIREAVQTYHVVVGDLLDQTKQLVDAVERMAGGTEYADRDVITAAGVLTRREQHVLQLLAEGSTNRTIARALRISERTVKNHLQSIYGKLEVTDRTGAVVKAMKTGLIAW